MEIFCVIAVVTVVIFIIELVLSIYNSTTHVRYKKEKLDINSRISKVETKKVGFKGDYKFRTIVEFDDGFEYISHDVIRHQGVLHTIIEVTPEIKEEVIRKAIRKHASLLKYPIPNRPPQVCSNCHLKGPFYGDHEFCPLCGCTKKKDL